MKTKNNVQKTVLRSAAVIVSFVLISFTVAAQGFWKTVLTNSSFNQIALAMVETSDKSDNGFSESETSGVIYFIEQDFDDTFVVEDWMLQNKNFSASLTLQPETEKDLQLEDWMMNENLFSGVEDSESPLALESWMTSEKVWKN
jgi:hypothetical protein